MRNLRLLRTGSDRCRFFLSGDLSEVGREVSCSGCELGCLKVLALPVLPLEVQFRRSALAKLFHIGSPRSFNGSRVPGAPQTTCTRIFESGTQAALLFKTPQVSLNKCVLKVSQLILTNIAMQNHSILYLFYLLIF